MEQVQIRINSEEEELILRAMLASGEKVVSTHIKRVYFEALKKDELDTKRIYEEIKSLNHMISLVKIGEEKPQDGMENNNPMLLTLLCGVYTMIRKSVSESIRREADEYLDAEAVENYLKEENNENNQKA